MKAPPIICELSSPSTASGSRLRSLDGGGLPVPGSEARPPFGSRSSKTLSLVADELARIDKVSNRPPWSPDCFAQELAHPHARVLGARWRGAIVAFLVAHLVIDEAHILNLGVHPRARGEGVGRALLDSALERFYEEGVARVTLEVRASNSVARALYASCGFLEVGVRQHYYSDDGEDAIAMGLDLVCYAATRATGVPSMRASHES